ncbi:MAG: ferredoxin [Actinomycetota bacterium]
MANKVFNLRINREICQGTGYCVRISPELFELEDSTQAKVLVAEPPAEFEEEILEASTLCPTRAITY